MKFSPGGISDVACLEYHMCVAWHCPSSLCKSFCHKIGLLLLVKLSLAKLSGTETYNEVAKQTTMSFFYIPIYVFMNKYILCFRFFTKVTGKSKQPHMTSGTSSSYNKQNCNWKVRVPFSPERLPDTDIPEIWTVEGIQNSKLEMIALSYVKRRTTNKQTNKISKKKILVL